MPQLSTGNLVFAATAPRVGTYPWLQSAGVGETSEPNEMKKGRACANEPIRVSARFRLTLESAVLALEAGAARDERMLPLLEDPDHQRRQQLLVEQQLARAIQLRELLAQTVLRPERAA